MPEITPDSLSAIGWLKKWNPEGPWTLVAIEPTNRKGHNPQIFGKTFTKDTQDQAMAWVDSYQGKFNLYFSANLTTVDKSPGKEEITHGYCIHLDADFHEGATDEDKQALLNDIQALSPPPPFINYSGGGFQAFYWVKDNPKIPEHLEKFESKNKRIEQDITGALKCYNINRLMRLPGTINVLNHTKRAKGRQPELARVIKAEWDTPKYDIATLDPHLPADYQRQTTTNTDQDKKPEDRTLNSLPAKLAKLITTGDATKFDNDRSKVVWFVTCSLLRLGWDDDQIKEILLNPTLGISAHVKEQPNPDRYAAKQAADARIEVAQDWERTQGGAIKDDSQRNIARALNSLGLRLTRDAFANRMMVNGAGPLRYLSDEESDKLWLNLDEKFTLRPSELFFRKVVSTTAHNNSYHPVIDYLSPLTWDGTPRIDTWLIDYAKAPDNAYVRAVSRLILMAAVRRVREPGCKFDEMVVLVNRTQGTEKSSSIRVLAVNESWFSDQLPFRARSSQEVVEQLSGRWIIESSDLSGMRKASLEHLKSFMTRQVDRARLAYGHFTHEAPRQCVFFGTTNEQHFLTDIANRRFWPVPVKPFDIPALARDVDQLWAEAARAETTGESIRLARELWDAAADFQEAHRADDSWASAYAPHLEHLTGRISIEDAYKIIDLPANRRNPEAGRRLTDVMATLGWHRDTQAVHGRVTRCFTKGTTPDARRPSLFVHQDPITRQVQVTPDPTPTQTELATYHQDQEPPF